MQVRKIRNLRLRHRISTVELGHACGLSPQRVSEIELGDAELSPETQRKLSAGIHLIADQRERELNLLRKDLNSLHTRLFELEEEEHYDL